MYPGVTFAENLDDADLSHLDLHPVPIGKRPGDPSPGMRWVLDVPVFRNGGWVRTYKEVPDRGS